MIEVRPRWRKVLRDLGGNKVRTILVILSIAVGVFAIGMINSTQILLRDDLSEAYALTNPASAELYASDFDEDIVHTVSRMDDVAVADARRSFTMQV